jgi:hypothetical protein
MTYRLSAQVRRILLGHSKQRDTEQCQGSKIPVIHLINVQIICLSARITCTHLTQTRLSKMPSSLKLGLD